MAQSTQSKHYYFHKTLTIPYGDMEHWVSDIFAATGLPKDVSDLVADSLIDADARGVYSHGAQRVKLYSKRIMLDCINREGKPKVIRDAGTLAVVDGDDAMGQVVGKFCMELAIEKAKEYGISFVVANKSNHYGRCAFYTRMALEHDMIGFSATIGGGNLMAPWGGSDPRVGNNPYSFSIPANKHYPVVLDQAMSVVAKGKVDVAAKTHATIPDTWALDRYGRPTTDPNEALEGSLRPIADYKGSGMAIVIGMLCSVISDANIGPTLKTIYKDFDGSLGKGQMFMAIDVGRMTDIDAFKDRMDKQIEFVKESPPAEGVEEVFLPGEMEYRNYDRQIKDGIVYPVEIINEIETIAEGLGVARPDWLVAMEKKAE
ncbi:MAG: Ldh family oxidoreductase [Oscillospiraceae bacterium]|nr:Ldh family oxidoreductase [Oscillospiraceae bacterium]